MTGVSGFKNSGEATNFEDSHLAAFQGIAGRVGVLARTLVSYFYSSFTFVAKWVSLNIRFVLLSSCSELILLSNI